MADRVYPASKPTAAPNGAAAAGPRPNFPAAKSQMYGAARPAYRPQPPKRRRRSCWCCCCLWLTLFLLALVLLAAIAGAVFYLLYRPHPPTFTVSSLRLANLTVTAAGAVTSRLDLAVTARNPNRKLEFLYGSSSVSVSSGGAAIGSGSFPPFLAGAGNTTVMKFAISSSGETLDPGAAADLRKMKSSLPLEIEVETAAGVKIGGIRTKKIGINVICDGIRAAILKARGNATASSPDARCRVKLRIKIWKWTI